MARKGLLETNARRKRLVVQKSAQRKKLKDIIMNRHIPLEERFQASLQIAQMPRNTSKTRIRLRCAATGRPGRRRPG